ncbi:MAG: Response regulator rcp1 [Segetibacter sp.]|jgi:CheY-like chemotaxis protein|nr:Response regulator rcp1 [Segetibacter sp.]
MKNDFTPLNIFLVDDDYLYQLIARKIIELLDMNCKIRVFSNGQEAINQLKYNIERCIDLPDVIFLDINMPVMNGWEFLKEYESISDICPKEIPVYMVTSSENEADKIRSKRSLAVKDYILKPLDQQRFVKIIGELKEVA